LLIIGTRFMRVFYCPRTAEMGGFASAISKEGDGLLSDQHQPIAALAI
jgi:hypothetical protein